MKSHCGSHLSRRVRSSRHWIMQTCRMNPFIPNPRTAESDHFYLVLILIRGYSLLVDMIYYEICSLAIQKFLD